MHGRVKGRPRYFRYDIAPEWRGLSGRETFANWALANGYEIGLVLDRCDNDSGYRPDNCQFITVRENVAKEHRKTLYNEGHHTLKELQEKFAHPSVTYACFKGRLKLGWPLEEALSRPSSHGNSWSRGTRS